MTVTTIQVKDASGATQTVSTMDALLAQGLPGKTATLTDRSGTIAAGGSAQQLAASNAGRSGLLVQNQSTGDLWISSVGTAAATQPSIWLPAGSYFEFPETGIPTSAISIFGATTGQAFSAREW